MAAHSSILDCGNPMDRGAWWAKVHRVSKELDVTQQLNNMIKKCFYAHAIECVVHIKCVTIFLKQQRVYFQKATSNFVKVILTYFKQWSDLHKYFLSKLLENKKKDVCDLCICLLINQFRSVFYSNKYKQIGSTH